MTKKKPTTYKDAGVDIEAADSIKKSISQLVLATQSDSTLGSFGLFGGALQVPGSNDAFVASIDGVGTKTAIAELLGNYETVGVDLVNHCVNDVLCQGAVPLFFLDYYASSKLDEFQIYNIVKGISSACRQNGMALLGGETAEMPDTYSVGSFDLVGAIVGIVHKSKFITGRNIAAGDVIIGLQSSGLHTNGYSLVRKVLIKGRKYDLGKPFGDLTCSLGEELLKPHQSYLRPLQAIMREFEIKGIAHITGGGISANLSRVLPHGLGARLAVRDFPRSPIFDIIRQEGNVPPVDMYRTFNMGVGMVIVVGSSIESSVLLKLDEAGVKAQTIGAVEATAKGISLDIE